jgi:FKBP-type peptidyl-prolyl cis-trans isomerase FklB
MKRTWLALSSLALAPLAAAPQEPPKPPAPPAAPAGPESPFKTPKEKLSYGIGVQIGMSLKAQGLDIDPDLLMQGLKGSLAGAPLQMTEAEIRQIMRETQQKVAAQQAERNRVVGDKNKKEGEAFLVANKAKEGVTVLPSGLQYKILKSLS